MLDSVWLACGWRTLTLYLMSIRSISQLKVVMVCTTDNTILVGDYGFEKIIFLEKVRLATCCTLRDGLRRGLCQMSILLYQPLNVNTS